MTGFVFGIGHILVTPPWAAASQPVLIVSLYSKPGSLKCTCRSIKPGITTLPKASISLGLTYICYTDMEEEDVQLSEDLHDCRWVSADEFGEFISNQRMLEDIEKAELY